MKKAKELQNLAPEEINHRIQELRKELMKDQVHISSGTAPANPGKVKQNKKTIARLLTILSQKQKVSGLLGTKKSQRRQKGGSNK